MEKVLSTGVKIRKTIEGIHWAESQCTAANKSVKKTSFFHDASLLTLSVILTSDNWHIKHGLHMNKYCSRWIYVAWRLTDTRICRITECVSWIRCPNLLDYWNVFLGLEGERTEIRMNIKWCFHACEHEKKIGARIRSELEWNYEAMSIYVMEVLDQLEYIITVWARLLIVRRKTETLTWYVSRETSMTGQ